MFGLNEQQFNVAKRVCKAMNDELLTALNGGKKYDDVAAEIITNHHAKMCGALTRIQFTWLAGYLNKQFGKSFDYE